MRINKREAKEASAPLELKTVPDSKQGKKQSHTYNIHQPAYRDNSGQSFQTVKINAPAGQFGVYPSRNIDGPSYVNRKGIAAYVMHQNAFVNRETLNRLIDTYIYEAEIEGINLDIAIAQMLYTTNFLGKQEIMSTNNYGGLKDCRFYNLPEGVRAHIQHLKGYATNEPPKGKCVDPRYDILKEKRYLGSSPTVNGLSNKWSNAEYANKINDILGKMYQ